MPYYHIWTIGCQMNKADSERLAASLEQLGYQPTSNMDAADIIVLNSCVVRQSAENRVVGKLYSLRPIKRARPDSILVLMGCMVDSATDELKKRFPYLDLFLKPQAFEELLKIAAGPGVGREEALPFAPSHPSLSTFVPIIKGCDNFCSYCIVPYRRGRERSRPLEEIVCEIQGLVARGVKEVVLLGQNVDSYGHDLPTRPTLADLLAELNSIDGLARIRFLTSHPKDMTDELIEAVARLNKVCEHISLPLQAGDDDILDAMRRGYTVEQYRQLVERIRAAMPDVALSTDIIVGFPGESKEQFQRTFDLLAELGFDTVHVAAYSPRSGTIAARLLEDDVPPEVKKERLRRVEELQEKIATEINAQLLGDRVEILVEGEQKGKWQGRTRTNKLVFFADDRDCLGQLVQVKIERCSPWWLQGKVEDERS